MKSKMRVPLQLNMKCKNFVTNLFMAFDKFQRIIIEYCLFQKINKKLFITVFEITYRYKKYYLEHSLSSFIIVEVIICYTCNQYLTNTMF